MSATPHALTRALRSTPVASFDVAVIATTWQGEIGYWNRAAEQMYGWAAEEALGRNIVEVTPALTTQEQAAEIMQSLRSGQPWEGEFLVRRRDGSIFEGYVADTPLPAQASEDCAIIGASAPAAERERVRRRNRLLRFELKRHLSDQWTVSPGEPPTHAEYYRCYLVGRTGAFVTVRDGVFASDAEAEAYGLDCLGRAREGALAQLAAVEIWNDGRRVSTLDAEGRRLEA